MRVVALRCRISLRARGEHADDAVVVQMLDVTIPGSVPSAVVPWRARSRRTLRSVAAGAHHVLGTVAAGALVAASLVSAVAAGGADRPTPAPPMRPADHVTFSGTGVSAYGDAASAGSFAGMTLAAPAVAMAPTPSAEGYWVAAADGGVFAFGDAVYLGGMGGAPLFAPIVGMAATPDGKGYWMVASDGGVFAFGDAGFHGGLGGVRLEAPVTGMAPTPDGQGYWMVASDGGVFAFGDAGFHGSVAGKDIGTWVTGIASTADGGGYWLVAATAGVLTFGDAVSYGPTPNTPPFPPTAAIAPTPDGKGYWLLQPDSIATSFADPDPPPDFAGGPSAVQIAASQIGPDPDTGLGLYCNPYGPCVQWCALFATWVWNQVGIGIPRYPFTGSVYAWAAARKLVLPPSAKPAPGDGVLFGTGPQNPATSLHIAIVAEVWPDGAITTIDGDSGPEPNGKDAVTFNGPFLPADSSTYNGMAVYAFVRP